MPKHDLDEELKKLWQEMSELTHPKCAKECMIPLSCCSPEYCDMAIRTAKEYWDLEIKPTGHPKLPLMGPEGCIAPPHVRQLCTLHVCEGTFWKSRMAWKKKYMALREKISKLEYQREQERKRT